MSSHPVTENASLHLVRKNGFRFFVQEGDVTGTLSGQMLLRVRLAREGVTGTFVLTLAPGTTISGTASARLALSGAFATFTGTAVVRAGTGTYTGVRSDPLKFTGRVASDGSTSRVKMTGNLLY